MYMPTVTRTMPVLVLDSVIGAPIDLVWNAWADPEQFVRWWGPHNSLSPVVNIERKEGDKYII